jgi:histidyl-tRNA synthetase
MPPYREKLVKFLDKTEGLCEDCLRRKETNPIRVLDCKNETCQNLLQNAPMLSENLCESCQSDFSELKTILDRFDVSYEVDTKLVRGLDYYNKTAFEFISDEIGAQSAIAGGGRYDRLVEFLDGKPTAGIGFAMGVERLLDLIQMPNTLREGFYICALCEEASEKVMELVIKKRKSNVVHTNYEAKSLKAHLKAADKSGVKEFVCIGEDELKNGQVWIKNLETKEERTLAFEQF